MPELYKAGKEGGEGYAAALETPPTFHQIG